METLVILAPVLIVFLITALICSTKVDKVSMPYIANGVYGKFTAYLAFDFVAFGAVATIGGIALMFMEDTVDDNIVYGLAAFGLGILLFFLGIIIYRSALKKCPAELKSKCISSMLITGLGLTVKPAFFILKMVLTIAGIGGSGSASGFSQHYYSQANGEEFYLQSASGSQAILCSRSSGQIVYVNATDNGSGLVYDSSGTYYEPED